MKSNELQFGHVYRVVIPENAEIEGIPITALPCLPAEARKDHCRMTEIKNMEFLTYTGPQPIEDYTLHVFEVSGYKVMLGDAALDYVRKIYQKRR